MSSGTWEFDPKRREWIHLINRFENPGAEPRGAWSHNNVLYEPALEAPVLTVASGSGNMYRFDHAKRAWHPLGPTPQELNWNEFYSTYVPPWKCHLLSTMKKGWMTFDVPRRTVTPVEAPDALKGCHSLSYDAANRVVIALATRKVSKYRQTVTPWALDVATREWTELTPAGPAPIGQAAGRWAALWYDPAHNVHLLVNFVRRDRAELYDGGVTETWAYRYKKAVAACRSIRPRSLTVAARNWPVPLAVQSAPAPLRSRLGTGRCRWPFNLPRSLTVAARNWPVPLAVQSPPAPLRSRLGTGRNGCRFP